MIGMTRRDTLAAGAVMALGASRALAQADPAREASGFSAAGLKAIQAPAREAIAGRDVPGAITMVWRRGRLAEVQIAGLRDIARELPMTHDAIFGIASM